jgi:hypothetical protein
LTTRKRLVTMLEGEGGEKGEEEEGELKEKGEG